MAEMYRHFIIRYDPPPIGSRGADWQFVHEDYDGAEDSGDHRCGYGSSEEDCRRQIDEMIEDLESEKR